MGILFDGVTVYILFIFSVAGLCFGYYVVNRILNDFYNPYFKRRPKFLKNGYLSSLFIALLWLLLIPVIRFHAEKNHSYFGNPLPWFGNVVILIFTGGMIFVAGVIISYLYYKDD